MVSDNKILAELNNTSLFPLPIKLSPVVGGVVNACFVLQAQQGRYFVKSFSGSMLTVAQRKQRFLLQDVLAEKLMAPKPVYLSNNYDFQVEEWVEHQSLLDSSLPLLDKCKILATKLWDIHQLKVDAPRLNLPLDWQRYQDIIGADLPNSLVNDIQHCRSILLQQDEAAMTLCHNDLAMSHVASGTLRILFDWEYASIGNRYFDIQACIVVNKLDQSGREALLKTYAKLSGIPFNEILSGVEQQIPVVKLTMNLWQQAANISSD